VRFKEFNKFVNIRKIVIKNFGVKGYVVIKGCEVVDIVSSRRHSIISFVN
jgi:hypothetical protein